MRALRRLLQRLVIVGLGVFSVWLIVFVVFKDADRRMPLLLAVVLTYGLAAYVILPRIVRLGLKVLHRRLIPSYTITGDGLPGDPVNIVLIGTRAQLDAAFAQAGWSTADALGLTSSLRMVKAFLLNMSYPTAPFSTLFLFGRAQDVGFQQPIGSSPRKRHHIRLWALSPSYGADDMTKADFWLNTDRPPPTSTVLWVGAATRDTGFSLTNLTFQITHATDSDTNAERDFVIADLTAKQVIEAATLHLSGSPMGAEHVNHYLTDGEVAVAKLADFRS